MTFDVLHTHSRMSLVFPDSIEGMSAMLPLLRAERAEFEAVLGIPVVFVEQRPAGGPAWVIEIAPDRQDNELVFDRETLTLTSRVADISGFGTTLNLLHSLAGLHVDSVSDVPHTTPADAANRIYREIAGTFPGFGIRDLDWDAISAPCLTRGDALTFGDFQRWIAGLGDAHTAIRRPVGAYNPPYAIEVTSEAATFRRVPGSSPAWRAGVRPGWRLRLEGDDWGDWLSRTGAPPHAKALTTGRRAIALNGIDARELTAVGPDGASVTWVERKIAPTLENTFAWTRLDDRTGSIWLHAWYAGIGLEDAFDEALTALRGCERLILDLQGNTGGNLVLATATRDRFLREQTLLGTIAFTTGAGELASPVEMWSEPSRDRVRWEGELIVLTDALTYSASEDLLLGLQGLDHVTVVGQRSGGGSGRPRTIRITGDIALTVSTALTYDRTGVCIENHGIPVDIEMDVFAPDGTNIALERALEG